jgi:hypothetical protein
MWSLRETSQGSPFKTETQPYKGSSIPVWIVFATAIAVFSWQIARGGAMSEWISVVALVVLSISGCALFIAVITYFNHDPIKVTVTLHAIRIDDGEEQIIIRLVDLVEIQRSQGWMQDEFFLKAVGGRELSLENLKQPEEFLSTIVANGSSVTSKGRAAAFALVTNRAYSKSQELVGRKTNGAKANSLELTNNFTVFLSTFPLAAILPAIVVAVIVFVSVVTFKIAPFTPATVGISALIVPSLFMIVCYVLFVEKQIAINGDQIIIETSTERVLLPKAGITNVSSRRAGLSRVIKIETQSHGTIRLRGYSNPDAIEGAIRWATTSAKVRKEATKA